jgi:hypothetical protein
MPYTPKELETIAFKNLHEGTHAVHAACTIVVPKDIDTQNLPTQTRLPDGSTVTFSFSSEKDCSQQPGYKTLVRRCVNITRGPGG